MTSRIQRLVRAGTIKRKVPRDVSPSTSLPPLVEGQLRCFLRVTISRVLWTVPNPPSPTIVRLRWWGESSNGTLFFLSDATQTSQKSIKTTACFPVRCGQKQFTSYLTDMGSLVLEVLTKPDHLPIARAQIAGIASLSLSHPVSGFYTLVSPTSVKLGELQVSLNLESLTGSGPPTENRPDGLQVNTPTMPLQHIPAGSSKEIGRSSSGNTPRGKDHLYYQNAQKEKDDTRENEMPIHSQNTVNVSNRDASLGQPPGDILSVILERGNKLRNAMVSALKSDKDSQPALKDTPLPLPKDNIQPPVRTFPHSGTLVGNILHTNSPLKQSDYVSDSGPDSYVDIGDTGLDILMASSVESPLHLRVGPDCLSDSLSDHNSEPSDSQYDESLLESVFYKTHLLDLISEETGKDHHTPSSSIKQHFPQSGSKKITNARLTPPHTTGLHRLLDEEQWVLLRSVRRLRVTIDSLTLPAESSLLSPRNTGKSPRRLTSKKCTYFVEYRLPETSSSCRRDQSGEVIRAISNKVSKGVVKFEQTSVFSVHLSTAAVQQWWETDLSFKIYSRKANQKKTVSIGKAVHPLWCLLQNKQLSQSVVLPVHSESQEIGPLKVTLQLEADGKSFSTEKTKKRVAWRDESPPQDALSPHRETSPRHEHAHTGREELQSHSMTSELNVRTPRKPSQDSFPHPGLSTSHKPFQQRQEEEEPQVLLHALLMVPDGKNFSSESLQGPNIYLNCKLLRCDEMVRSVVSWGQKNPVFNFVQVIPVALTSKLLERMKNNNMIIEVWQKTRLSENDQLVGLVRLPLHQFYLSFRDPKIAHLLLQAQFPVVAVDSSMPVIDVFSGNCRGNLRVVLAMGQSEQIVSLQRSRDEECDSFLHPVRPVHLLDQQQQSQQKVAVQVEAMREHIFVITVEKVCGLTPLQSTVWGEADCYVQYSFPCHDDEFSSEVDQSIPESNVNLKSFRTTTTLCVPDPLFSHTETHVLLTPEDVPVQRVLLSSLSGQGLSSGGGIQFGIWCRYYYPNVREHLVARGMLPLSKLCAMVTKGQQPKEGQRFSFPLIPRIHDPTSHHHRGDDGETDLRGSGLLEVYIQYKHRPLRHKVQPGRGTASRTVTLVLEVHRACGLKAAARLIAEKDERFGYFAGVGLNPYVTVQLSLMPETEKRCTRTVAKTFCPEFNLHAEVGCELLVQRSSGETCSLAEQLDQASAVFTVWNRDNRKALNVSRPKEVILGSVKIPLADLIHKRTGISGWFAIYLTHETSSSQQLHTLVGGLEISIHFAHHSDRERVIKAARGLAWEIDHRENTPEYDDSKTWDGDMRRVSMIFSVPRAWIPLHCLLLPGHTELLRSTYCYFRYKFYDQETFCSQMKHPCVSEGAEEDQATVSLEGSRTVELTSTQPLTWYLREERLEVQVWVAFKKDKARRPSDTDRLVGSAFVDLSSLAKLNQQKLTLSGVYPLFRRSATDLQGAAVRVHITLMGDIQRREESARLSKRLSFNSQEEEAEEADEAPCPTAPTVSRQLNKSSRETPDFTSVHHSKASVDESFPVTITVDRAMHLNVKGCPLAERSAGLPCSCVSYVTADSAEPVYTAVVANTVSPVWEHHHECRLSKQLLVEPQQSLVFEVWHKGEIERVIGYASVDLSPLLSGFPSVCGWYNITDFSGQCHGQLKVSITPLRGIPNLQKQRRTVSEETVEESSALPFSYQTTATYSSFPSHISKDPEQNISSPDHMEKRFSEKSSESDRHLEHMDKIHLYHQILHERAGHINPSTSMLFSTLRKKLDELDNIQRYFSRKLSTPTFPSMVEHDGDRTHEEPTNPQSNTSHLLLKSTQFVDKVNNIIGGLRGTNLETIPSGTQRASACRFGDENLQTNCGRSSVSQCPPVAASPFSSPPPETLGGHLASEEETIIRICEVKMSEGNSANSSEADEDYEEVVVKPKPLNDVTSLTDRTSPWTSVLSDPDLVSPESLDPFEGPSLSEDDEDEGLAGSQYTRKCGGSQTRREERHSFNDSDAETDDEKTRKALNERPDDENSEESDLSPVPNTHNAPGSTHNQDTKLQHTVPPEVPNFFLSSRQLEASMRTIRLAPSFSQMTSSPVRVAFARRRPRLRPALSPQSMKKEAERIAKIFATHSDQTR